MLIELHTGAQTVKQPGHQEVPRGGRKEDVHLRTGVEFVWAFCDPKLQVTWQLGFNELGVNQEMLPRLVPAPDVQHCPQAQPTTQTWLLGHVWWAEERVSQE